MIQSISIHSLLLKLKQGHEEALDVLYPRYARLFYAYARRRSLSHEDAEDIVQTTFWRMLDRISSYDEQSGGGVHHARRRGDGLRSARARHRRSWA